MKNLFIHAALFTLALAANLLLVLAFLGAL